MDDEYTELLSDYIDDEDVPPAERARIERHLQGCAACRTTLVELRLVAEHGRTLPDSPPAHDLWPGVAARIGVSRASASPARWPAQVVRRRVSFTLPQLAAAALALMVLSGGTVWLARVGSPGTDFEPLSAQVDPSSSVPLAEPAGGDGSGAAAATELDSAVGPGGARMDPATLEVLRAGLTTANRAIDDCQRALVAEPANAELNAHLANAQRIKLMLLEQAGNLAADRP